MRQDLAALWSSSTTSKEQLVKQLENWCRRAEETIRSEFGSIDALINGAGGNKPVAISEAEAQHILRQVQEGVDRPRPSVVYDIGEEVKVTDGPRGHTVESGVISPALSSGQWC